MNTNTRTHTHTHTTDSTGAGGEKSSQHTAFFLMERKGPQTVHQANTVCPYVHLLDDRQEGHAEDILSLSGGRKRAQRLPPAPLPPQLG